MRYIQNRVFSLFDESLDQLKYMALGNKKPLKLSLMDSKFTQLGKESIWRKAQQEENISGTE